MRRFACSLVALSLLGVPRLARAHDPLDDVSGEDDPNAKNDDQPRSHRKERQEAELSREVQEREEAEFHLNQEKDEFLRDRAETREVIDAQRRRSQLSGSGARPHRDDDEVKPLAPAPKHLDDEVKPAKHGGSGDGEVEAKPARGDVDPTDPTAVEAKPNIEGGPENAPTPAKKKKKKHADE
jgi:hypothetical protein